MTMNKRGPSPTLIVALIALGVALGGTAVALKNGSVTAKHLAEDSVTSRAVRDNALRATDTAFAGVTKTTVITASPDGDPIKKKTLLKHGPFKVVAQCYEDGANIDSLIYATSSKAGAVLLSDESILDGNSAFLGPATAPEDAAIRDSVFDVTPGESYSDAPAAYTITNGKRAITGLVSVSVKNDSTNSGNGAYGPGDRCLVHAQGLAG